MSETAPHRTNTNESNAPNETIQPALSRRALLVGSSVAAAGLIGIPLARRVFGEKAPVFIGRNQRYDGPLRRTIRDGLLAAGAQPEQFRSRRVLLKPNMVEPSRAAPHMTTHPAMVVAAAEVFRDWGAEVVVGEGPGHVRDTELALVESRMQEALDDAKLPFADLNYEPVRYVPNLGRASKLEGFYLPQSVVEADWIVSMPKLKTHHWTGFTASMKNLFGVVPGIVYGWPKNVLHHAGIPQCIFDLNATIPNRIAIVDGIDCMEGDGPIMGTPKSLGVVVVGMNPTAVDATIGRLIGIEPHRVNYLAMADGRLGPIAERSIRQEGERWRPLVSPFQILDAPHLRHLRPQPGSLFS